MKLIHITDTHLVGPGLRLYGLDPSARLNAAIADINAITSMPSSPSSRAISPIGAR